MGGNQKERTPLCETINRFFHFLSAHFSVTSVKQKIQSRTDERIYFAPAQVAANKEQEKATPSSPVKHHQKEIFFYVKYFQ